MRIAVLRNPTSGRGAGRRSWPEAARRLAALSAEVVVFETASAADLVAQAREAAQAFDVVAAAGGDGTLSRTMEAVLGSPAALAVLPLGTGNDFARTLGFGADLGAAVDALGAGRTALIDVGRWRVGERTGHFLNVAGCGFDAAVADAINRGFRGVRGRLAYLLAIAQTLRRYRPTRLRLVVDGEPLIADAMLCAFANAQSYGAGLRVAPTADLQDGLLDLVLVGDLGRLEFVRNLPSVMGGGHLGHPKVHHRPFRALTLEADPPGPFLVDGELIPPGPVEVSVVPGALRFVVPAGWKGDVSPART